MSFKTSVLILILQGFLRPSQASCLCHVVPNFQCPPPPLCCESGMYSYDECGCCLTCAKSELQPCGLVGGACAKGLSCLKLCTSCETLGADSEPCVFPFTYEGVKYDKCTSTHAAEGAVWCATDTHRNGTVIEGRWGDCSEGCPGARNECNEQRFQIIEGQCVNPAVPGAIPNWRGSPAYQLLPPTDDLFKAPLCDLANDINRRERFYKNTCRCSQGEDAIEVANDGSIRGNCTGVDTNLKDDINPVWCFLENVRDAGNPKSGCFSDTTWSSKDGRFWSSQACFGLPPISDDGIDELPEAPHHLLGRNHPLVKQAAQIPFKKPPVDLEEQDPFSIYYDSSEEYNYDYDENVLPIINQRNNEFQFLPTPLPIKETTTAPLADPLPLTTAQVTPGPPPTSTPSSTTTTSTTTTSTTTTTTPMIIISSTSKDEEIESSTPLPTILPASTSKWKEVEDASSVVKPLTIEPKVSANEIMEETQESKDGSKLLVVQALHRAAKNIEDNHDGSINEDMPQPNDLHVDLGIFGNFWLLQKPKAAVAHDNDSKANDRPRPVFIKEDYLDKFPELKT